MIVVISITWQWHYIMQQYIHKHLSFLWPALYPLTIPEITRRRTTAGLILARRLRRRPIIKTTLAQCLEFADHFTLPQLTAWPLTSTRHLRGSPSDRWMTWRQSELMWHLLTSSCCSSICNNSFVLRLYTLLITFLHMLIILAINKRIWTS